MQNMIPKKRFKDFTGSWSRKLLKEICEKIQDGNYGFDYPKSEEFLPSGIPFLTSKALGVDGELIKDKIDFISPEKHSQLRKAQILAGDILFTNRGANVGQVGEVESFIPEGNIGPQLTLLRTKNAVMLPRFLKYCMLAPSLKRQIHAQDSGSAMNFFGIGATSNFKVSLPSFEEQHKIAEFLSVVDEKICLLKEKHALLQQYKKGVMQKLFSQEIRFKDHNGQAFPDWKFSHGDKLFSSISDKKHNSDLPILAITQEYGAIPRALINYQVQATDESIASYKVVNEGDFIISLRSFQGGIEYSRYKGICSPAYIILRPCAEIVDDFYRYYLKTGNFIQEMKRRLEGIRDGKILSYKYFSEIKLPYPCIAEQQKIATFIMALDKKLDAVQQQIDLTQTFKKGLLHQMFV